MTFFFAVGTPTPVTPASKKPTGGGGIFFPRFVNKTLLANQLNRRNPGNHTLGPDAFPALSSFFNFPNDYDHCLAKDFKLFDQINPVYMSCKKKPDCFLTDERDWVDAPRGGVVFNPVKSVPLPSAADGDVVVLSMRVPIGYDGVILGQFQSYTGPGFVQGSGDIVWRVNANGRYLRDCGNMLYTLGSSQDMAQVYGGLQVRSGNLIQYTVSAPNTTGVLPPPGTGNILAGLHGWFYPRK